MTLVVKELNDFDDISKYAEFFIKSFHCSIKLNYPFMDEEEFFKKVLHCIYDNDSAVVVLLSDGIPVSCGAAYFTEVWALHFDRKGIKYPKKLQSWWEKRCKEKGIVRYSVLSKRCSGAAIRCFEKRFGLKRDIIMYSKRIK